MVSIIEAIREYLINAAQELDDSAFSEDAFLRMASTVKEAFNE